MPDHDRPHRQRDGAVRGGDGYAVIVRDANGNPVPFIYAVSDANGVTYTIANGYTVAVTHADCRIPVAHRD